jgi:hypothetical protein
MLYAPGLALLRVTLLKTYGLWTSRNLLLDDGQKLNIEELFKFNRNEEKSF